MSTAEAQVYDDWSWWRNALDGVFGPITEDHPECGFFRIRERKNGPWIPCAIWTEDGTKVALIGDHDAADVTDTWMRCARFPVTEAAYRYAMEHGHWPGDAPASEGHNNPPADDFTAIADRVEDQARQVEAWLKDRKIESQAEADRCEKWANDLLALVKKIDAERTEKVKPHLEMQRKINAQYNPLIDKAKQWAQALKRAVTPFLEAREREKREAAAKAIANGAEPARVNTKATTSGTSGRKVSLRTVKVATIKEYDKALAFFAEHPEVKALIQQLANKVVRAGGDVPGVVVTEERQAV